MNDQRKTVTIAGQAFRVGRLTLGLLRAVQPQLRTVAQMTDRYSADAADMNAFDRIPTVEELDAMEAVVFAAISRGGNDPITPEQFRQMLEDMEMTEGVKALAGALEAVMNDAGLKGKEDGAPGEAGGPEA